MLNCLRHYASSWLETEAEKTTEQLATGCPQSHKPDCSGGLDSG